MKKTTIEIEGTDSSPDIKLDHEWLELILDAKRLGITKEEISNFLLLNK